MSPDNREKQGEKNGTNNFRNTKMGEEGTKMREEDSLRAGAEISLKPMERACEGGVSQQPVEAPTQRQGESVSEGAVEQSYYGLSTTLIPHPPVPHGVGEVKALAMDGD
ncbi:unnamed protein product [Coccothraustes coccothraustes]